MLRVGLGVPRGGRFDRDSPPFCGVGTKDKAVRTPYEDEFRGKSGALTGSTEGT